jgi:hypothetical protein
MANNPLQKYFRQPKVFISLPSGGVYNDPGVINGDAQRLPVFGMTGMDEIILKTADALISGESTARVIQSCCPSITDPWNISTLDLDILLTSIRIATYGNEINLPHVCTGCATENEYLFDLSTFIDHYSQCTYDNTIVLDDLTIIIKPLNYQQSSDFALRNFEIQQKLYQINSMTDDAEKKEANKEMFDQVTGLRNTVFAAGIESVDTGTEVVTERAFINEWIANVDRAVIEKIRAHVDEQRKVWTTPAKEIKCENCGKEERIRIDLDQSNFFDVA